LQKEEERYGAVVRYLVVTLQEWDFASNCYDHLKPIAD